MREFRIKVNNEKTYVVKANDYNQAVKTLHSKLNDDCLYRHFFRGLKVILLADALYKDVQKYVKRDI